MSAAANRAIFAAARNIALGGTRNRARIAGTNREAAFRTRGGDNLGLVRARGLRFDAGGTAAGIRAGAGIRGRV